MAWKAVGNASEIAMIKFVQEFRDIEEYRAANPNLFKIPFNSKNKYQVCTFFIHACGRARLHHVPVAFKFSFRPPAHAWLHGVGALSKSFRWLRWK